MLLILTLSGAVIKAVTPVTPEYLLKNLDVALFFYFIGDLY